MALIGVLWALTLLSIMAASFSLSLQRNSGLVKNAQDRTQSLSLAEAGVQVAMLMLSQANPNQRWRTDGMVYTVSLPQGGVKIKIFDESGKFDINAVQESTLNALLSQLIEDADKAHALADAILDWRDVDALKRLNGAEADDYKAAGKHYAPRNLPFQALDELQMVLGMNAFIYKRLEPLLTIYSGQDGINPQKASKEALLALPNLDKKTVEDYLMQRSVSQTAQLPQVPGIRFVGGGDQAYSIFATAEFAGLKVLIKRQRSASGLPFSIAAWSQSFKENNAP